MKNIKFIIFILLILLSCSKDKKPEHVKQADKMIIMVSKELEKKYNLSLITEGGSMMHDIKILSLGFISQESLNIDQARKLIISCSKDFLNKMNNSIEIRPYLHNFPASEKNVEIVLYFQTEGISKKPPNIAVVGLNHSEIIYYYKYERLKEVHSETYEEALKLIQNDEKYD